MKKYFLIATLLLLASCTSSTPPSTTPAPSGTVTPKVMIASPTYGSGAHKLTIWADFQCPACAAFASLIEPIFQEYADKGLLTITYKQYPLTAIHINAKRDSLAALCSAEQGKYIDYKKKLYALESTRKGAKVSDDDRVSLGEGLLDVEKLRSCIASDRYMGQVESEIREGDTAGVTGTPTVFLDGKKLDPAVYRDPTVLKNIMDRLLGVAAAGTGVTK